MNQKNLVTIEVEIDDELLKQVRAILQPLGLTPEDALRIFIEFCGDSKNEEVGKEMILRWIEEDKVASEQISGI